MQKTIELERLIRIKEIFSPHYKEKISARLAFKIYRFCSAVEKEEAFYSEKLRAILDTCCEKDEKGEFVRVENGNIRILPEFEEECRERLSELGSLKVDIPDIDITEDDISEITISVVDAALISDFLSDMKKEEK